MITFEVEAVVTNMPRAGQLTIEGGRASWEANKGKPGFSSEFVERRFGRFSDGSRYTTVRMETSEEGKFDITFSERDATKAMVDRAGALAVGDRVKITGVFEHHHMHFYARGLKVTVQK